MQQLQMKLYLDKADKYQAVAERAGVRAACYKYRKRRGRFNSHKVAPVIASADVDWDPDQWDGDVFDSTTTDSGSEPDLGPHYEAQQEPDCPKDSHYKHDKDPTWGSQHCLHGTDEEEATQETTARASTSHPKKRATTTTTTSAGGKQATATASVPVRAGTQPATPAPSVPDTLLTQQATPTPVEGESLEAPASTGEELDASVEPEGDTEVTCPATPSPVPTPSPQHLQSPTCSEADPSLRDCDLPTSDEYSPENAVHMTAQPTTPAPSKTLETRLSTVEARQEAMLDLLRHYIADGEETRRGIATAIAGTTAAIAANTAAVNASARLMRDCLGAVTQVLTSMLLHMQRPRLAGGVKPASDSLTTSTLASSVPTSPVHQIRGSARHTEMPPPDRKKSQK
ncbi:uncharacterized protein [Ambystoma mexicanum]|uniref:uncharacterized protein n=1 Tax=Ambystoma mexicanum TaxID=8296 RepID=UPI0037E8FD43